MGTGLTRNWWLLVLRGVLSIIFGVLAFAWPGITLGVLVLLFAAFSLVDGIFALAAALTGHTERRQWWSLVLEGLTGVAVGIMAFAWPAITALVLLYLIAGWAVATGIFEIIAAIQLRKHIEGEWALGLSGVLSVLVGLAMFAFPIEGALAVVWLIAINAIVFGVLLIVLGVRLARRGRASSVQGGV